MSWCKNAILESIIQWKCNEYYKYKIDQSSGRPPIWGSKQSLTIAKVIDRAVDRTLEGSNEIDPIILY